MLNKQKKVKDQLTLQSELEFIKETSLKPFFKSTNDVLIAH